MEVDVRELAGRSINVCAWMWACLWSDTSVHVAGFLCGSESACALPMCLEGCNSYRGA